MTLGGGVVNLENVYKLTGVAEPHATHGITGRSDDVAVIFSPADHNSVEVLCAGGGGSGARGGAGGGRVTFFRSRGRSGDKVIGVE